MRPVSSLPPALIIRHSPPVDSVVLVGREERTSRRTGPTKALPPPDPGTMTRQRRRKAARNGTPL